MPEACSIPGSRMDNRWDPDKYLIQARPSDNRCKCIQECLVQEDPTYPKPVP